MQNRTIGFPCGMCEFRVCVEFLVRAVHEPANVGHARDMFPCGKTYGVSPMGWGSLTAAVTNVDWIDCVGIPGCSSVCCTCFPVKGRDAQRTRLLSEDPTAYALVMAHYCGVRFGWSGFRMQLEH
jgi:hypothetical protein